MFVTTNLYKIPNTVIYRLREGFYDICRRVGRSPVFARRLKQTSVIYKIRFMAAETDDKIIILYFPIQLTTNCRV